MTDEFDFEFKDTEFENAVKQLGISSYREKELIKLSRAVDKFGNKFHDNACHVMIGIVTHDDFFKFYSNMNPQNHITVEMLAKMVEPLARLIKKTCDEIQQARDSDESPVKEVLKAIEEEIEARG